MLEESSFYDSPADSQGAPSNESSQERINRIKKSKNIRKDKVLEKRGINL